MRPFDDDVPSLDDGRPLPDPRTAVDDLVAVDGEMSVTRLVEAYTHGIFPWTADPITWWSPDPRAIFDLAAIHVPRRLQAQVRKHPYRVTFDAAFEAVMEACATAPRDEDSSWISEEFLEAYTALHRAGIAHSIELWRGEELAAGIYGVAVGGLFAGESMFHRESNASKIALVLLQQQLAAWGFVLFDTQVVTPVTEMLGAKAIPREEYLQRLQQALLVKPLVRWR
ncbi:MAG: leucyl/phenylalanyl-tRNA--protein transferase [Bryobacteraceae bacterium]